MAAVDITVRGNAEAAHAPEHVTVHLLVATEGSARDAVLAAVTRSAAVITDQLPSLTDTDRGPVTRWSSDSIRTWSNRPWASTGKQLPFVYYASADVSVTFSDFGALDTWIGAVAVIDEVSVNAIEWLLTDGRRAELTEQSRNEAIQDAIKKARSYARSLGCGEVRPIAIADVGMLGVRSALPGMLADQGQNFSGMARSVSASSGAEVNLTPRELVISTSVDVRFVAYETERRSTTPNR